MEILISVIAKITEYTVKPIGRQLGYLFYYNYNIKNLANHVDMLKDARESVQHRVDEARNNAEAIEDAVQKWLHKVDDQITESCETLHQNEGQENKKCCISSGLRLNFVQQRYRVSRKAKKTADEVLEIKIQGSFERVSYNVPLAKVESSTKISDFMNFESRISTMEEIMNAILDDNVNRIGVYGMGGVGKTMMVREISRKIKDKKSFLIVTSTVSQTPNLKRIQGELGDKLGLKFEQETEEGRAIKLYNRLKMEESILIVLDDIWNYIDLETIGIPSVEDHKGCKILFTSRDKNILSDIDVHKKFEVKVLGQEESWNLFIQMAGEINDRSIAMEIVKECAHLPIAITTVAKALRNKPLSIWKDALNQLRNPIAMNIRGMDDKVYASLKLSYEQLQSKEAKLVFLLCSMFPEDHHIKVEDLHVYAMGMGLLQGIETFAQGRHRIIKLVDDLTSSSLLQEIEHRDGCVKMHDLIRDVAILIASKDDRICTLSYVQELNELKEEKNLDNYNVAYLLCFGDSHNLPQKLMLPKAQLLIVDGISAFKGLEFSRTIFEEMKELKVLELVGTRISLSPSSSRHLFANLQSLRLIACKLKNIDMIGELRKLEILSFRRSNIIEIPSITSQLINLKVLDLSNCCQLKVIPPNMLLRFTKLEELYLEDFDGWEEGNLMGGRKNVSLCELKHLSRLSAISITIKKEKIIPKQLFSRELNLEKFRISIGRFNRAHRDTFRRLSLQMESRSPCDDWIEMLIKRAEELYLGGSIGEKFLHFESDAVENVFSYMKHLHLCSIKEDNLLSNEDLFLNKQVSLPNLESLKIIDVDKLKMVYEHKAVISEYSSFVKLKRVEIYWCKNLEKVFPANVMSILPCLEILRIESCELLEGIFELVEEANAIQGPDGWLSRLSSFTLMDLPNLKYVWSMDPLELQVFGNLNDFSILKCPELKKVYPVKIIQKLENLEIEYRELMETLDQIKSLKGDGFHASKSELCDDAPQLLPQLKFLTISGCLNYKWTELPIEIVQIFPNLIRLELRDIFVEEIFPNLNSNSNYSPAGLSLYKLPKLKHSSVSSLRNLGHLRIHNCHGLIHLMNPRVATALVELYRMEIEGCKMMTTVIPSSEVEEEEEEIVFKELKHLGLEDLPRLTSFHSGKCSISFPCLKSVTIQDCPELEMNSLFPPKLKYLEIKECRRLNSLFPSSSVSSLTNLRDLTIHNCHGLRHLMNPRVAAALVRLIWMTIVGCKMMTTVIPSSEVEEEGEEIVFKELMYLRLEDLPRLTSFHSGKCIIRFPWLDYVSIWECPEMKVFSVGITTTPLLEKGDISLRINQ